MNIAIIFAGGTGSRMNSKDIPKQFLLVHGKPIIAYTIQKFQSHKDIDAIIISCLEGWNDHLLKIKEDYRFNKIVRIVKGGATGQLSIYNALKAASEEFGIEGHIVLIHDAVRPLITEELISLNIETVKIYNNCITCAPVKETILLIDKNDMVSKIPDRDIERIAKAPQCFYLNDILKIHDKALDNKFISSKDSASLMNKYDIKLHTITCDIENIKITTQIDFYMLKGVFDMIENKQLS